MLNFEYPRWFRLLRRRTVQTIGLVGFWGFCEMAERMTRTPVPGAVIGLMILLVAIGLGTLLVMLTTALTIEGCHWALQSRRTHG